MSVERIEKRLDISLFIFSFCNQMPSFLTNNYQKLIVTNLAKYQYQHDVLPTYPQRHQWRKQFLGKQGETVSEGQ